MASTDDMGNRTDVNVPEHNRITPDDDNMVRAAKEKAQQRVDSEGRSK